MRLLSVWENGAKDQNIGLLPHYGGVSGYVPTHHPPVTWGPAQGEEACLQGEAVWRPVGPAAQDHVSQWQESFHQERCFPEDWSKWRQHRVRRQVLSVLLYSWGALPSLLTTSKRHKVPFSNIFCRVPHFHIFLTNLKMLKKTMFEFSPIMHPTEYFLLISNCDLFPVDFCTPNLKHIANILPRHISMNNDVKIVSFFREKVAKICWWQYHI